LQAYHFIGVENGGFFIRLDLAEEANRHFLENDFGDLSFFSVVNKVLLLLNEHGDPSFLFPNLSTVNIHNQLAKFEKNLSVGFISEE